MKKEEYAVKKNEETLKTGERARYENSLRKEEEESYRRNPNGKIKKITYLFIFTGNYTGQYRVEVYHPDPQKVHQFPNQIQRSNPKFRHILVQYGTGRLFFPGISTIQEWKRCFKAMSGNVILQKIKQWIQKPLAKDFEQLAKDGVYPVNLEMWSLYVEKGKGLYEKEIENNQKEQKKLA